MKLRARMWIGFAVLVAALTGSVGATTATETTTTAAPPAFQLTVLHANDGESKLLELIRTTADGSEEIYGGAARFKTLVDDLRKQAPKGPDAGAVTISSGDNFLAGPQFNASLEKGVPFYDTIAMNLIGFDASAIGNHEFDFGPDVLADLVRGFEPPVPFLSANLDFSGEPGLQALVNEGRIAGSTVLNVRGEQIGVVGATTDRLPSISSPRRVTVDPNMAQALQTEIDSLESRGIDKIILTAHLQAISEEMALTRQLSGVDIVIAGGGSELLANPNHALVPGDRVWGSYPQWTTNAEGASVPVVTTNGDYKYVGRLVADFDENGVLVGIDTSQSGPVRVSGTGSDAVAPDKPMTKRVVDPVAAYVSALAERTIGTSEVPLDGTRTSVRTKEANLGNLLADSLLWQARRLAPAFGAPVPQIALQNSGGIRNNSVIPAGSLTELHTFEVAPFANFVSVVPSIPAAQLKEILENAVSRVEFGDGRFAQVAGLRMTWDARGTAQVLDSAGNVTTAGTRVREVVLDDGTVLVSGGNVVTGAPAVNVATIDFLARGGDRYPFRGASFTTLGVTYQQALRDFIQTPAGLNGLVRAQDYPEAGGGRITRLN